MLHSLIHRAVSLNPACMLQTHKACSAGRRKGIRVTADTIPTLTALLDPPKTKRLNGVMLEFLLLAASGRTSTFSEPIATPALLDRATRYGGGGATPPPRSPTPRRDTSGSGTACGGYAAAAALASMGRAPLQRGTSFPPPQPSAGAAASGEGAAQAQAAPAAGLLQRGGSNATGMLQAPTGPLIKPAPADASARVRLGPAPALNLPSAATKPPQDTPLPSFDSIVMLYNQLMAQPSTTAPNTGAPSLAVGANGSAGGTGLCTSGSGFGPSAADLLFQTRALSQGNVPNLDSLYPGGSSKEMPMLPFLAQHKPPASASEAHAPHVGGKRNADDALGGDAGADMQALKRHAASMFEDAAFDEMYNRLVKHIDCTGVLPTSDALGEWTALQLQSARLYIQDRKAGGTGGAQSSLSDMQYMRLVNLPAFMAELSRAQEPNGPVAGWGAAGGAGGGLQPQLFLGGSSGSAQAAPAGSADDDSKCIDVAEIMAGLSQMEGKRSCP